MKLQISALAAALFLMAAPGISLAQSDNDGNNNNGGNNNNAASQNQTSDNQCGEITTGNAAVENLPEKCRNELEKWVQSQTGESTKYEGDIAVGSTVPDSVTIVEYPQSKNYGYVMLNDRRVLVDRGSRKVVKVW